jgi:aminomethyltransferase
VKDKSFTRRFAPGAKSPDFERGMVDYMEQKTPLYEKHIKAGGKMVPFAGYLLPVQYETGIIVEHMAVRKSAGLFDVSHMGEILLKGKDALLNVQKLVTNDCSNMNEGRVKYSPMCNENGGVVDDLLVYKISPTEYLLVVNASNRYKDVEFMKEHIFGDVELTDVSDEIVQIALQGPNSFLIIQKLMKKEDIPTKYYTFTNHVPVGDINCLVSKTGYTGENGYEIYCNHSEGSKLWDLLIDAGKEVGLIPCGLGARDTLRLEAGMPLYGHEMNDVISPMETGLSFVVNFNKEDFIGKNALHQREPVTIKRVGLKILGRGIAREGNQVMLGDMEIGTTTSGTHCPYLEYPVAMALVDIKYSTIGTKVDVIVRGRRIEAIIVELPFYKVK